MRVINDYFGRVGYLLGQGRPVADVLLLHSVGSAQAVFSVGLNDFAGQVPADWGPSQRVSRQLESTLARLVEDHRDVDLGDEHILGRVGRVRGRRLVCGKMAYEVVIVPPSTTWESSTLSLLRRFVAAGGKVIFVKPLPKRVDGSVDADAWRSLASRRNVTVVSPTGVLPALGKVVDRGISVQDSRGREIADIRHIVRDDRKRMVLFFCNVSRTIDYSATIRIKGGGRVERWDPMTGESEPVPSRTSRGFSVIQHDFAPAGSLALVVHGGRRPVRASRQRVATEKIVPLPREWQFRRLHLNSMTLDFCRYRVANGRFSAVLPVWQVRHRLEKLAGTDRYSRIQPWAKARMKANVKRVPVTMRFEFESDLDVPKVSLVVEQLQRMTISVNGRGLSGRTTQWHWDRKFSRIDISQLLKRGRNRIDLSMRYGLSTPVEDAYLVGDFGTRRANKKRFALTTEPDRLRCGDWGPQGYHFYAGNMFYDAEVSLPDALPKRVLLRLKRPMGCAFVVYVDGREVGSIVSKPWEIDISEAVRPGVNRIGVEVLGTLRNTFGPLHNTDKNINRFCGPYSFIDVRNWSDDYQFMPYGLGRGAEVVLVGASR
jgi:hypothetical protein